MSDLTTSAKIWMGAGLLAFLLPLVFTFEEGAVRFLLLERPAVAILSEVVAFACAGAFFREVLKKQSRF